VIKRRTVANDACDAGRVSVNGKIAKAGHEMSVGDIVEIKFGNNVTKFEVTGIKESVRKDEANEMYRLL
jgi:ribosomal 50S subunit-recycling heat shock protein